VGLQKFDILEQERMYQRICEPSAVSRSAIPDQSSGIDVRFGEVILRAWGRLLFSMLVCMCRRVPPTATASAIILDYNDCVAVTKQLLEHFVAVFFEL
jgi:hypothetical protein